MTNETSKQIEARAKEADCRRWARRSFAFTAAMMVWSGGCAAAAAGYAHAEQAGFVVIWATHFLVGLAATGMGAKATFSLMSTANFWRERGGR